MGVVSKLAVAAIFVLYTQLGFSQQLRLGKDPYSVEKSAVLELYSDNQGLLLPRIADTSLINALIPPDGMIIYFIPEKKILARANGAWQSLAVNNAVVTSLNGNTGALTMDTSYISNFNFKVRSLHSVTAPLNYNSITGVFGISQASSYGNGYLSSTDWNTFNNKANSFTRGNLSETGSGVLTITGGSNAVIGSGTTIQVRQATASQNGFLSSADWNTFNNKLSTVDTGNISNFYLKVRSLLSAGTGISYNNSTGVISSTINTGNFWNISGNSGTNPSNNFIGTTDNQDLVFKTNNTERARIVAGTGDIKVGNATSGTLRATKELVLRQDGDTYGSSILRLRNRTAENGAIFETTDPSITLVDFIFKTASSQRNIRYEARSGYAKAGTPSFHIGGASPDNPTLAVGDSYAAFNTNLKIGNYNTPTEALDVTGNIRFSGALMPNNNAGTSGYVLSSSGAGAAPTWRNFTLANLNDVTITSPSNGQMLQHNGTRWVNTTPSYLTSVDTSNISNFYLKVRSLHTVSSPLTYNSSTGLIGITQATTSTNGYLSSTDWNTFNSKQAAGNFLTDPGGNGIVSRTALNTTINRTITGTANRIVINNGDGVSGNPTIDISSSYTGQTSITTLGTISSGTWNGTALTSTYLPSSVVYNNQSNTYTLGSKQIFNASNANADIRLLGNSSDPSSLASGDIWYNTTSNVFKGRFNTTTRQFATLEGSETFTNKIISGSTNSLGAVSMVLGGDATGDIYYRNSSGILTRLPIGSNGQFLNISAGIPTWITSSSAYSPHNLLSAIHSDVTAASVVRGDLITGQGASAKWARLALGSQGQVLQAGANELGYTAYKLPTAAGTTGQQLRSDGTDYVNKTTNTYQDTPADPKGTNSTAGRMMGLAGSITPSYSGIIMIIISGDMGNNGNKLGAITQIRYGTGSAPTNGAVITGTAAGSQIQMAQNNKAIITPFSCNAIVSGLTIGTIYWIDLSLAPVTGGTASVSDISISIVEL